MEKNFVSREQVDLLPERLEYAQKTYTGSEKSIIFSISIGNFNCFGV